MIRITVKRTKDGVAKGFAINGHADFADYGQDIICAAISALAIATANGLMNEQVELEEIESGDGHMSLLLSDSLSEEKMICARAILETFVLGVEHIASEYGTSYVTIKTGTL